MKKKDLNEIAKIEKAIKDKYGEEAIQNPKGSWSEEKEEKYLKGLKRFYEKTIKKESLKNIEGIKVRETIKSAGIDRNCPICGEYSFSTKDDVYMVKFQCCYNCYIQYIEGREERWKSGWRPNN